MPKPRPLQPETPPRDAFQIHRAEVAKGLSLAYLREGVGAPPSRPRSTHRCKSFGRTTISRRTS